MGDSDALRRERERRLAEIDQWLESRTRTLQEQHDQLVSMVREEHSRLKRVRRRIDRVGVPYESGTGYLILYELRPPT
ncbi:hypothetical protein KIPB_006521 [Kipferlia bialata]|uniref:Uncharacterized protein n=1 Tax=Kipferlia bialata TaxID=797122 RepID=A0A391NPS2_9EUKA|nr:hypothetical protein KIPB_006521 [Kipferlia bialata]|eukprot:g6521.t1